MKTYAQLKKMSEAPPVAEARIARLNQWLYDTHGLEAMLRTMSLALERDTVEQMGALAAEQVREDLREDLDHEKN